MSAVDLINEGVVTVLVKDLPQPALRRRFNWLAGPWTNLFVQVSHSERLCQFHRDQLETWLGSYGKIKRQAGYDYVLIVRTKRKYLPSVDNYLRWKVAEIVEACQKGEGHNHDWS